MTKKRLIFIGLTLLVLTLTLSVSGCGREELDLDGKNIAVFELNGGLLDYGTSSINTKINYAYHPGSYILDPTTLPGYSLTRRGYVFTGWYKSADCAPDSKWDFEKELINTETLTLYAGWEKEIVYSFGLYYVFEEETVKLGEYKVDAGEAFSDRKNIAKTRSGYTFMGYYSDKEMTTVWDAAAVHPGGEVDLEIPVYLDYIEGEWEFANDYETFKKAVANNRNVQLSKDIDCGGAELSFNMYTGIIKGNGYTVSNFTVPASGSLRLSCAIFSELGEGAHIKDLTFENAVYKLLDTEKATWGIKVAALAINASGATVENVTIRGILETDYAEALPKLLEPFYEETASGEVNGFNAEITVEKQETPAQ